MFYIKNDFFFFNRKANRRRYTGTDQIQGYEGKRFALSVGPIVLAPYFVHNDSR